MSETDLLLSASKDGSVCETHVPMSDNMVLRLRSRAECAVSSILLTLAVITLAGLRLHRRSPTCFGYPAVSRCHNSEDCFD